MATPLLSKQRVSGGSGAVFHVAAVVAAIVVVAAVLAVELTRANHLLEARQAELARVLRTGASERSIAELRLEVASLERRYAAAIRAMASAP
jgi:hypothetical protein